MASAAAALQGARVGAGQDQRERCEPEEVPVHFHLGQGVAELPHRGARGVVHEHLFWPRLRRDVVDQGDALVEEVPTP